MEIVELIAHLLLPPGLFILGFLLIALAGRKSKFIYSVSSFMALSLYLMSIEPVKDFLYKPLEESYPVPKEVKGDVIVVLGGDSYNTGVLQEASLKRLLTGFVLHKETGKPIILSGGSKVINSPPEAQGMKSMLLSLGVDKRSIITDVRSTTTRENARFTKELMLKRNYKSAIIVTSAYHMKRAIRSFEREGIKALPYPTDFKRDMRYNLYSFIPKTSTLHDSSKAIREYIAQMAYELMD